MKKSILILIILTISSILIFNEFYKATNNDTLSMIIKDGTLTNTSATIIISDNNPNHIYGEWFRIDEQINGEWQEVTRLIDNDSWTLIGYKADKNNKIELEVNWETIYGKLDSGKYRIVKAYTLKNGSKKYAYAEFTIK